MFSTISSNQDLGVGVARAGFTLIRGVAFAIVCMLIFVPEASLEKLEPMYLSHVTCS